MSQHVPETCNESSENWFPLTEYSVKSGISLSTIRRKIKSNTIAYRLEKGKYFIFFENRKMSTISAEPVPIKIPTLVPTRRYSDESAIAKNATHHEKRENIIRFEHDAESIHMVSDAFEHALSEKDERIKLLQKLNHELEDRLNELRLLVQVLEEKYEIRY
ncbi:MAG: hypothetical protein EXR74_01140 [Bdellovibrionales bacterium]|nr:hypothetical protein [Bdellovibrionales bacterium]